MAPAPNGWGRWRCPRELAVQQGLLGRVGKADIHPPEWGTCHLRASDDKRVLAAGYTPGLENTMCWPSVQAVPPLSD
ncbi:hypothetical protein NDU88_011180 [Pleurodeles waltl]|uniref:Uncharacterized protein n=1 Tax=Pleurodeles waltl TaxID=8319 RepID=A0AAV7Q048_PLEWA|nr:hypothetical protein NDU88_011180 [Pleurodeles waltl]